MFPRYGRFTFRRSSLLASSLFLILIVWVTLKEQKTFITIHSDPEINIIQHNDILEAPKSLGSEEAAKIIKASRVQMIEFDDNSVTIDPRNNLCAMPVNYTSDCNITITCVSENWAQRQSPYKQIATLSINGDVIHSWIYNDEKQIAYMFFINNACKLEDSKVYRHVGDEENTTDFDVKNYIEESYSPSIFFAGVASGPIGGQWERNLRNVGILINNMPISHRSEFEYVVFIGQVALKIDTLSEYVPKYGEPKAITRTLGNDCLASILSPGYGTTSRNMSDNLATLYINDVLQESWMHNKEGLVKIFLMNQKCQIKGKHQFHYKLYSLKEITAIKHFLDSGMDSNMYFIGIASGPFHRRLKRDLTKLRVSFDPTRSREEFLGNSSVAFIGRVGHKLHTDSVLVDVNGSQTQVQRILNFGVPFELKTSQIEYNDVVNEYGSQLSPGGSWSPGGCKPRWRIAVIIPFRHREQHLWIFLRNMNHFLQLQNISFTFFVVEQAEPELFNRATLMNIGYKEAAKLGEFDCFAFHDVDLIPEDLTNVYACADQPRHLAVSRSAKNYRYATAKSHDGYIYFGGAILMTSSQIETINGFPNTYFGWGGEDDDILTRVETAGYDVMRYPMDVSSYTSLVLEEEENGNPHMTRKSSSLRRHARRHYKNSGLNNLYYELIQTTMTPIYINITVRIPGPATKKEAHTLDSKERASSFADRLSALKFHKYYM